jgi:DNA modification methylase
MMRIETIGDATLYLGDCLKILPTLGKVDAVVADPPYGMAIDVDSSRFSGGSDPLRRGQGGGRFREMIAGDDKPFNPTPFLQYPAVVLWGANHYAARLPVGTTLVWIKRNDEAYGTFLSDAEIGFQKDGCGVYCFRDLSMKAEERNRKHPNQKPLPLMQWCIERVSKPGETILDPFMGSGTTGVACANLGRKFIVIEIEPKYFDIACRRIADAYKQPRLFPDEKPAAPTPQELLL